MGDGQEISVYRDKWVAGFEGSLRSFGETEREDEMKVQNLLAPENIMFNLILFGYFI